MIWDNYKHQNTQGKKYSADCQVVTAVNAYYFLTGKTVHTDRKYYRYLCKLGKACYGSAICIEKVHEKLGLDTFEHTNSYLDVLGDDPEIKYPIEMSVWHPKCGFHSTLIVERELRCSAIRVLNFRWATSTYGWLWEEDLNFYINYLVDTDKKEWALRKFRLKENHELYQ